jgi:hypothetical protein
MFLELLSEGGIDMGGIDPELSHGHGKRSGRERRGLDLT